MKCLLIPMLLAMLLLQVDVAAQQSDRGVKRPFGLGPDDKPAFPAPPVGFDRVRDGIARGGLEMVAYESKTLGMRRRMLVYTPPDYSPDKTYNVLYLLHGIHGDESDWHRSCAANIILDNLHADGKLAPMIVVFPNGRALPKGRTLGADFTPRRAFENFTGELMKEVIPLIDARYPVKPGREHRAVAGFSMGGGQALNIGLGHLDQFAWVGGFSAAPLTRPPGELVPDPAAAHERLRLLYLACGEQDALMPVSKRLHDYLEAASVPHIWHVSAGGHDVGVWKMDLYHLAPLLFREANIPAATEAGS